MNKMIGGTLGAIVALGMMIINPGVVESGQTVDMSHKNVGSGQSAAIEVSSSKVDMAKYKELSINLAERLEKCKTSKEVKAVLMKFSQENGKSVAYAYYSDTSGKFICVPEVELPEDYDATIRPWYKMAYENKGQELEPYVDALSGKIIQTYSHAVFRSGKIVGVVSVDFYVGE